MRKVSEKLLSGSALRTVSLIANGVVAFLLLPFMVHHLGDRLYGFWALAGTFVGYYGLIDFGLTATVAQYISGAIGRKDLKECNLVFNTALRIHSMLGGLVVLVTLVVAALAPLICHSPEDASLFREVILLLGVTVALDFPLKTYKGLLLAEMHFDMLSWLSLLYTALRTVFVIWAVLAGYGLLGLVWGTFLAAIPISLLTLWLTHKTFPWIRVHAGPTNRDTTKRLFSYSVYLFIADIADNLRFGVDPVVITAFVGLAAVTHYRIASVFADQYLRVMISMLGVFQPLLSQLHGANDNVRIKRAFFLATKISVCVASFLCFGLIAWGRPMILRWMGPHYMDAYGPLVVLSLAMLVDLWQLPSVSFLNATFNHRFYALSTLAEGLLNLAISLILVRRYGILGVALGTLVAAVLVRIIVQPWWMCKVTEISYPTYMRQLSGSILRCAGVICVSLPLVFWGLRPDYKYIFSSAVWAAILYALGSWFVVFGSDERKLFWTAFRRRSGGSKAGVSPPGSAHGSEGIEAPVGQI